MPLVMIDVSETVGSARVRIIGDAVYDAMTTLAGVAVHVLSQRRILSRHRFIQVT